MIHLRHIRLRAITAAKVYGADIPLLPGLNIIQAHNTSGKSTALQAVIYALGLERALGPLLTVPLPYSMRERIHASKDDPYEPVLQSFVEVVLINHYRKTLVVRRDIVGGKDTKLIQTQESSSESAPTFIQRDFYVHDPGAAQRESGFHSFLASFIGWQLPLVPRFDGSEGLLYLEAIFPMLFVEQKRGWSVVQGPFPTFLKIQDVARRVMEFLLDLDAGKLRRQRGELRAEISAIGQRWNEFRQSLDEQANRIGRLRGVPANPSAEFAHAPNIRLELFLEDDWQVIDKVLSERKARLRELESMQIKTADEAEPEIQERQNAVRQRVDTLTSMLELARIELSSELQEQQAVVSRLQSLSADLRRNQDALKLKHLGSSLGTAAGQHICPTCHQNVESELLPAVENVGMGLEENVTFVKSQIDLYKAAETGVNERVDDCRARYRALTEELREKQAELRSLRQALLQPSSSPSRASIEEIVRLQNFVDRVSSIEERAAILSNELGELAKQWVNLQDQLKRLPQEEFSALDQEKVIKLEREIQNLLSRYGFASFQSSEITLSRDNFRPLSISYGEEGERLEKEIGFEISASDGIRLKWSYYLALLAISGTLRTNHPSIIIFDEPGQQEIEPQSLYAFLDSVYEIAKGHSRQVIVSTSEPIDRVRSAMASKAQIVSFEAFMLQPIPS